MPQKAALHEPGGAASRPLESKHLAETPAPLFMPVHASQARNRPGNSTRLIFAALLLPLSAARGQDALYSAISLEQAIASPSNQAIPPSNGLRWGPVQFALGAYASASYNDNINGSQTNAQSDVILNDGVNLGFDWPATDRSDLRLGTAIGYLHYLKYNSNGGLVVTPDSALNYAVSWNDCVLTFYDEFSYTRQAITEAALANISTQPQFANTAGLRVEWDPDHWILQAGYSHDFVLSDSANNYLNHSSEDFYGRAGWRFAQATQAGIEGSAGLTSYEQQAQGNNNNYSMGVYCEWQILQSLQLTLRGGPTFYQFNQPAENGGNSTLDSYYASLSVSHQITDFLSQSLEVNRSVSLGANQGSSYMEQLTAGYSLSWALTRRISLGASLSCTDGQQPWFEGYFYLFGIYPIPIQTTENYRLYSGGLQASWQFTDHLSASVNYNHSVRDSNLSDRSYSANSISFQINYGF